jgi:hypothetical protein
MSAEIEFPLSAKHLSKRVLQLIAFMDQGDFDADEDGSLLERIFDEDELEWLDDNQPKFYLALSRMEDDYAKLDEAQTAMQASQDALQAHLVAIQVEEAVEAGDLEVEDIEPDGDSDDDHDDDDDRDEGEEE